MTAPIHQYSFPTTIKFGPGAGRLLPDALGSNGLHRPLLVTDKGLAGLPAFGEIVATVNAAGLEPTVFSGIWGNPVVSMVTAGVAAYRDAAADCVVAVGGGAAMDIAKLIALMVHHPGAVLDYEDGKPDARPVDREIPWLATVPTTAGTGSEVGRAAVVSEDASHVKRIVFHPRLLARLVLIDPHLTLDLPPTVTASTGMDALTHLVEAYIAQGYHPMCDGIALEGVRLVAASLPACYRFAHQPGDRSEEHVRVRGMMMNAAMMGAVAFQKGLAVTHSCAHALSAVCDMHHGLANGICIPYAMEFNRPAVADRFTILARTLALSQSTPEAFIDWLRELRRELDVPDTLAAAGVPADTLDRLVDLAYADPVHQLNPRPVGRDDFRDIFTRAFGS